MSEDSNLFELANSQCKKAYLKHSSSLKHSITKSTFYKIIKKELELDWKRDECDNFFDELDVLDVGKLTYEEFRDGMVKHIRTENNLPGGNTKLSKRRSKETRKIRWIVKYFLVL
eukprot:UN02936